MKKNIIIGLIIAGAFAWGFQIGSIYETMQEINAIRAALAKQSPVHTTTEAVCPPDETCEVDSRGHISVVPRDYTACEVLANGDMKCPADGRDGRIVLEPITR